MDDRNTLPGIQLPGGLLATWIASRYLDRRAQVKPVSVIQDYLIRKALKLAPEGLWLHGPVCAAHENLRKGLGSAAEHPSTVLELTGLILQLMKIELPEREINEAIYTGGERADNNCLWDIDYETSVALARSPGSRVNYEVYPDSHVVGGLAILTTPQLFNNELFREEHNVHHGQDKVGILVVTPGAYAQFLSERLSEGEFRGYNIAKEVAHLAIFTAGIVTAAVHDYTRAGIVVAR